MIMINVLERMNSMNINRKKGHWKHYDNPRRYGCWSGKPNGNPEDESKCIVQVSGTGMKGFIGKQCSRKRGHGLDGLYCKQHAKQYPAEQEE